LVFISLFFHNISGAIVDRWFEKANSFYEKESCDSAVTYYQKILDTGLHNRDVFYNLGNAYFRLNKLGLALLNYEKAKRLSPTDPEIIANLRFAQLNIVDRIPEPKRTFAESVLWKLHTMLSLNLQMWILLALLFFISISFTIGLFAPHNLRLWLIYTSSLCIIISGMFCFSIGKKIYDAEKKKFAIVLEKSVDAKNQLQYMRVQNSRSGKPWITGAL
jgi:tetratricopeptide (TPR) repeat protein